VLVPENSTAGCVSTPCADSVCENNACVYHAKNESQSCNTAFDPRSRITRGYGSSTCLSQFGTCGSGICAPSATNDGGFCLVPDYADAEVCQEAVGTCAAGECISPRYTCYSLPAYCNQTVTAACSPNSSCGPLGGNPLPPDQCAPIVTCAPVGPPPLSGTIECGTIIDQQSSKCCGGQVCVCPPTAGTVCFALECWSLEDLSNL
jgi:hypothetical protein